MAYDPSLPIKQVSDKKTEKIYLGKIDRKAANFPYTEEINVNVREKRQQVQKEVEVFKNRCEEKEIKNSHSLTKQCGEKYELLRAKGKIISTSQHSSTHIPIQRDLESSHLIRRHTRLCLIIAFRLHTQYGLCVPSKKQKGN